MSIQNSSTGEVLRSYNIDELKQQANLMRGYDLAALCAAASGHAGGTLSIMDITAALYLRVANHDPKNPNWPDRDRIVWSTGHKAPSLYLGLAFAGFCPKEDVALLRKLYLRSRDANNVGAARVKRLNLGAVDVKAGDTETFLAEEKDQGKADVAESNDAHAQLARFYQ